MASTLITGLGLVGTSFAQHAIKRGDNVVFYDVAPRKDFLASTGTKCSLPLSIGSPAKVAVPDTGTGLG